MTITRLQEMIVQIKYSGNQMGLTDAEVGALEICTVHHDAKRLDSVTLNIELAEVKRRANGKTEKFVMFENKTKSGIIKLD